MTGTGILKAFDFNGNELWSARHPEGLRPLRAATGATARRRCCTTIRSTCRCCTACTPTIRRTCCASTRRPARRLARRAADRSAIRVAGRVHDAGAAALRHAARRSSSPAATWSPATIRRPARSCGAPNGLNPDNDGSYRIVASPVVHGDMIYRAVARAADAGAEGGRPRRRHASRTCCGRSTTAPTCRRRSPTAPTSTSSTIAASCGVSTRRPARRSTAGSACGPATYSGSPVLADGKIYITNEDGVTSVVKAGPEVRAARGERFRRLHAQLAGGSDGQIFFRTAKFLYAIGKGSGGSGKVRLEAGHYGPRDTTYNQPRYSASR